MFTIQEINKSVAKKLNVDIKLVEKVNDIYYKEIIKALNDHTEPEIKLLYLGTFRARYSVVKKRIRDSISQLKLLRKAEQNPATLGKIEIFKKQLSSLWKLKQYYNNINIKAREKKNGK